MLNCVYQTSCLTRVSHSSPSFMNCDDGFLQRAPPEKPASSALALAVAPTDLSFPFRVRQKSEMILPYKKSVLGPFVTVILLCSSQMS